MVKDRVAGELGLTGGWEMFRCGSGIRTGLGHFGFELCPERCLVGQTVGFGAR